jgi:uncharacterized circularly permuted ATP-grasp superfamily protein
MKGKQMANYRAVIKLYPAVYEASSYEEAEQFLEDYKEQLANVVSEQIQFRDYHLSVEIDEES